MGAWGSWGGQRVDFTSDPLVGVNFRVQVTSDPFLGSISGSSGGRFHVRSVLRVDLGGSGHVRSVLRVDLGGSGQRSRPEVQARGSRSGVRARGSQGSVKGPQGA